jgi:hypothetical protein
MTATRLWLLILLVALVYGLAQFSWYASTPLGRVPVLDERENFTLAEQIAGGSLPKEPFYRAMGYPLLLASLRLGGISAAQLPAAALLLGVVLHALTALLTGALARRWFDDPKAGLIAGLLVALNPVLLNEATQRLDGTLGTVLFLCGLLSLSLSRAPAGSVAVTGASLCWALAALTRPQFLLVWLALPFLWLWCHRTRAGVTAALAAVVAGGVLFLAQGGWQRSVSGGFRIMPWQGAYNLWSANQPGAHGRYYYQTIDLAHAGQIDNPARLESIALYQQETGRRDARIDEMNAHWYRRFLGYVSEHPAAWAGQLARKTYALLNNWEQYNNKTYAFHKARSPWLRFNPIGWGVLLVLGLAGAWRLYGFAPERARELGMIALIYAAGVVLFFVSARFRMPLVPLLCGLAGGALARPAFWRELVPARQPALAVSLGVVALLTFSWFDHVRDDRTFIQDHLLIARAAQVVGDDDEVWQQAQAALALDARRTDAREFLVTSGFNRQLAENLPAADLVDWRENTRQLLTDSSASPAARIIAAAQTHDVTTLRTLSGENGPPAYDALGALGLIRAATTGETARLRAAPWNAGTTLFLMARQRLDPVAFSAWAQANQPAGWDLALAAACARLFPVELR